MMLFSVSTSIGLQKKIQEKVAAFNGHIIISKYDNNRSDLSLRPISIEQDFYPNFKTVSGINHVQAVANKGGVIRTNTDFEGVNLKNLGNTPSYNLHQLLLS